MHSLRRDTLAVLLCAALLAGCGGEIARIEGLPQTRDVSAVPWPRLVDTPAPPTGLRPETGAATLAALDRTRAAVTARAAQPGPPPVARAELGGRVARIRQQAATGAQGVDRDGLSARAARLSQARAIPTQGLSAQDLTVRGRRVAAARGTATGGVDAGALQERARRIASARVVGAGAIDAAALQARARRVAAARAAPSPGIDRDLLAARGARGRAQANALLASRTEPATPLRRRDAANPLPRPKPAAPPRGRNTPVLSDAFRKRAEEARRRARERAASGEAE